MVSHLPAHRRLIEPVITPRFVPTCSDDLLEGLGKLSETECLRIQSHLAEAHDQVEWVRQTRGTEDIEVFHRVCYVFLPLADAQTQIVSTA
jgi:guanine deaminase